MAEFAGLAAARRMRRTPFSDGVEAAGVSAYSVYNHMLLPAVFRSPEEDYHHLKSAVQVWDVSCERQVEVVGPDAVKILQLITPRDMSGLKDDQCFYIPTVDHTGGMLNDPVALRVGEDRFWVSIADGDLCQWIKGLAVGLNLDVRVFEPDVSPLGIQGPKADDLAAAVFGEAVRDIKFFRHASLPFSGKNFTVARSGYSKQGGFEIYVEGAEHGMPIWNALMEAGKDLDVRAGCPNLMERIEGGLLSYGNDMTVENTPYECGLGKFCHPDRVECIGREPLLMSQQMGPSQQIRAIEIGGDIPRCDRAWGLYDGETRVGQVTSAAYSPDFKVNVAIGMVAATHWEAGTELRVETQDGPRDALVRDKFWI